jgi:hypothetical protein
MNDMIETNKTKSVAFAKKGIKWALYCALVGAIIGLFGGCVTEPATVYDDVGPCLSGRVDITANNYEHFTADDTLANRQLSAERGYKIDTCYRKASEKDKRDYILTGLGIGALNGAAIGCSLSWLVAVWFLFLMLLGQVFASVRVSK